MKNLTSILQRMHPLSKRFKGANLSGHNLSGWVFVGADMRGANLSGAFGHNVDLRCANLAGANLNDANTAQWDCTGANMSNASLDNAEMRAIVHGVNFSGASMRGVKWHRGGNAAARGVILPETVDFATWTGGKDFHAAVAKIIEQNTETPGALRACDYILGQSQRFFYSPNFPCWVGFVSMCHAELDGESINQIHAAFEKFPNMRLMSMWNWAEREIAKGSN